MVIDSNKVSNKYVTIDTNQYIDHIISSIPIEPGNYIKNVDSFLHTLSNEGIIEEETLYDKRGVKTMDRDIKRLTGRIIDASA